MFRRDVLLGSTRSQPCVRIEAGDDRDLFEEFTLSSFVVETENRNVFSRTRRFLLISTFCVPNWVPCILKTFKNATSSHRATTTRVSSQQNNKTSRVDINFQKFSTGPKDFIPLIKYFPRASALLTNSRSYSSTFRINNQFCDSLLF